MDEILFKSSQRLENFQIQLSLAATHSKDILHQYSQQGKSAVLQVWNSAHTEHIRQNAKAAWQYIVNLGIQVKERLLLNIDPQKLYYNLAKVLWDKWSKRDVCFLCAGFICGSVVGVIFALSIKKKDKGIKFMQAIQCTNYLGIESVAVIENAKAPDECSENEVIINVKAASVHIVDAQICQGYGQRLRKILQKLYNKKSRHGLPITLGRDCSGIITDVGSNVKRIEIGDEVWLSVPFWHEGTMSQCVIVPEYRVSRKPKNIGFEGASSLPYAGTLALNALKELEVNEDNAKNKKFFIFGGCTPVGCILIQVLKHWEVHITATCTKRAMPVAKALGANDVLIYPDFTNEEKESSPSIDCINALVKELHLKEKFDFIVITENCEFRQELGQFCIENVVSTLPAVLFSDSCGIFSGLFIQVYIYLKSILERALGVPLNDFDEGHMCYMTLDELTEMVETGKLQTVVDKVLHPQDIEIALNHIQSYDSIGSTVITFR